MEDLLKVIFAICLVVAFIVGLSLLMALPMMWLVNYLFSPSALLAVFGMAKIGFWKAFWLNFFLGWFVRASSCKCSKK